MKRSLSVAAMALVLASAAFAGNEGVKPAAAAKAGKPAAKTAKKMHCAVMTSNPVDVTKATAKHMYADYKGNRYFFCCAGCPEEFKKDPAKFAKNDHIPAPKKTKS
jgi:YHS domain-containing protein